MSGAARIEVIAPGRVNLIGEYTDIGGGLVLPMAIDLATTIHAHPSDGDIVLRSADEPEPAVVPLDVADPAAMEPPWARYVAGVVAELRPEHAITGTISTTLPVGAGLSSSAALEVAVALALGFEGTALELAELAQRAEQRASGVPCGIMDQLASASGVADHALRIGCHDRSVTPVALPPELEVRVLHSGQPRRLVGSAYGDRRAALDQAEAVVGPLRLIDDVAELTAIDDATVRRRARHVVTENARVRTVVDALASGDVATVGEAMAAGHRSLRDDLEVSTPVLDALVERLAATPGVHGARLTGAGFGGCVVALCRPGAIDEGWLVRASDGARQVPS